LSVVIIGAGEMGYHLARRLSYEKRDVVVIDRNAERVNHVHDNLDVKALVGRGASPAVLREAGIEKASILIAVTDSDEANLMACYVGGALNGFMTKVARLRQEDFSEFPEILDKKHLNLDLVISPENEAVKKLMQVLEVPAATDFIEFAEGRIKLFGIRLRRDSPFVGQSMIDLREQFPNDRLLIPVIFRDSEVIIPKGSVVLREYDTIYVIAPGEDVPRVIQVTGMKDKPMKSFMILGGTPTAVKVAKELEKRGANTIRLVEPDAARCEEIAAEVDYTMVLKCESVDEEFLRSEGVGEMDAFLALTDEDESNALTALLAKRMGADRVAALTNKLEYHRLVSAIGVDVAINPRLAGASRILQYIRKGKIISVSMLPGEGVEAIEFEAMETSQLVGVPLKKVRFPDGAILGAVDRNRRFFIPHGETVIEPGDRVIVFVRREAIPKVEKLVTVRLDYF
jgi:trk system potassium uptake protein TrkA